jgi:hypothetical protein
MAGLFGLSGGGLVFTRTLQWYKQEGKEGVGMEMMRGLSAAAGGMI